MTEAVPDNNNNADNDKEKKETNKDKVERKENLKNS